MDQMPGIDRHVVGDVRWTPRVSTRGEGAARPTRSSTGSARRVLEVTVAVVAVILLVPLLAGVALALLAEGRGPLLYTQERLGHAGRRFRILKFRTMIVDAERESGPVWAVPGDPRVTRVGRALRATHLDELPQLFNVIRGEMSIVGPRPERPEIAAWLAERIPSYDLRHSVPPGLTGLAQVRTGYDTSLRSVRRKLRYDLVYIRSRSAALDLAILLGTLPKLVPWNVTRARRQGSGRTLASLPTEATWRGESGALPHRHPHGDCATDDWHAPRRALSTCEKSVCDETLAGEGAARAPPGTPRWMGARQSRFDARLRCGHHSGPCNSWPS